MVGNQPRSRIARINQDGTLNGWTSELNNSVYTLCLFAGKIYFGGLFTNVNGVQRNRIAAVDANTGTLDSWNPNAENEVRTLLAVNGKIIAGGNFYTIGGQIRNGLAMLDPISGLASDWNPSDPSVPVEVSAMVTLGNQVYVGGKFAKLGGATRTNAASVHLSSGVAGNWNPRPNNTVNTMLQVGPLIYLSGVFSSVAGNARSFLASVDTTAGGVVAWNPSPNDKVYCLSSDGSTVMVGGDFTSIGGRDREGTILEPESKWRVQVFSHPRRMALSRGGFHIFRFGRTPE
jgi:hypothetical protein